MRYCALCRNCSDRRVVCLTCKTATKKLREAYKHYLDMQELYRRCCGGISTERDHFYFHGKYFESSYPKDVKDNGPQVSVEHGVNFYKDFARCYYARDFDSYCDSVEYGEDIPYSTANFWDALSVEMDKAAKAAWDADLLSCPSCGYHMGDDHECCGDEDIDEEEATL